jgi:hypothetical protein
VVSLSRLVLLTHTQKPLESWSDFHVHQYHLLWLPLVKFLFKKPSLNLTDYQHIILSSPTISEKVFMLLVKTQLSILKDIFQV